MNEDRKAWLYATGIMLVVSIVVLMLRVSSIVLFMIEFEVALVYVPTIVLVAVSVYLAKASERFPK